MEGRGAARRRSLRLHVNTDRKPPTQRFSGCFLPWTLPTSIIMCRSSWGRARTQPGQSCHFGSCDTGRRGLVQRQIRLKCHASVLNAAESSPVVPSGLGRTTDTATFAPPAEAPPPSPPGDKRRQPAASALIPGVCTRVCKCTCNLPTHTHTHTGD